MSARLSWRFVAVAAFFVTALVVSNIVAVKLVEISGRVFPAGLVVFPLSYLLGDVLTEVYGLRAARAVIWLGFACNLLAVGAIQLAIMLPAAPFYEEGDAYYAPPGHTPVFYAGTEIVEFSPTEDLERTIEVVTKNMEAADS